jgi:hypothetical protein
MQKLKIIRLKIQLFLLCVMAQENAALFLQLLWSALVEIFKFLNF